MGIDILLRASKTDGDMLEILTENEFGNYYLWAVASTDLVSDDQDIYKRINDGEEVPSRLEAIEPPEPKRRMPE